MFRGVHENKALQADWDRFDWRGFEFFVIEEVAELDDLKGHEQYWLDLFPEKYNVGRFSDSCLGMRRTAESRKRMSIAALNRPKRTLRADHRAKISAAHKGRKASEETRAKMSANAKKQHQMARGARELA